MYVLESTKLLSRRVGDEWSLIQFSYEIFAMGFHPTFGCKAGQILSVFDFE